MWGVIAFAFEDTSRQVSNITETLQTGVIIVGNLDHQNNKLLVSIETLVLQSLGDLERDLGCLPLLQGRGRWIEEVVVVVLPEVGSWKAEKRKIVRK